MRHESMHLHPFHASQLRQLMTWFPDKAGCQAWGGPEFRYPFDEATFREDSRVDSLPSWSLVGDDGTLAGFGQYYLRLGRCHLARLATAPAFRRRGLGTRLVRELCRRGCGELGVDSCSLFVLPGNDAAKRLYTRMGFSEMPYPALEPALADCTYMVARLEGQSR